MKNIFKICFWMLITSVSCYAQLGKDSLLFSQQSYTDKTLSNFFEKQLSTYNYNILLRHFYSTQKLFFGIKENFNSTIIKSSINNIKDEQYLWAIGQYNLNEKIQFGIHFNNNIYADDRNVGLNRATLLTSSIYLKFLPDEKIQITPFLGFEQNNQIGISDNGFIYGTEANIRRFEVGDFEINSFFKFHNEEISPRKNVLQVISFDLQNKIEENFSNVISGYYSQQRRDFYFANEQNTTTESTSYDNIQSRTESSYFVQDRIKFSPLYSPFSFDLLGRAAWRGIDRETRFISESTSTNYYDTKIEELKLELASVADYKTENLNLSIRFTFSERDEKHRPIRTETMSTFFYEDRKRLEEEKNNTSALSNISFIGQILLSSKDRLLLSLFHRKLKYDTPSENNFDDRDELLSMGRLFYEHEFNPMFRAFLNLEGSLNKTVYILTERSANNNIKRILKFSSGGTFNSGGFNSTNSAEVSANYTVFDYEELNPNYRSYSFRQFAFRDSSKLRFNKSFSFHIAGYVKLSEQGDFKWSSFSGKPLRYLDERFSEPKFIFNYYWFEFGFGIRYFSLETYNYTDGVKKTKISNYQSLGPLAELSYLIAEKISLKFLGWYEFIRTEDNSLREMANLNIRLNYNL
jgi:hypothetical protein